MQSVIYNTMKPRVTLADIAEACQVTKMTVSRVLSEKKGVRPDVRERVRDMAEKMGYRPDPALSALTRHRRQQLSIVQPRGDVIPLLMPTEAEAQLTNPYYVFSDMVSSMHNRAAMLGYRIEPVFLRRGSDDYRRHLRTFYHRGIRGILVLATVDLPPVIPEEWSSFAVVMLGSGSGQHPFHAVRNDFFQMMLCAVEVLRAKGYRRIGYVATETDARSAGRPVGALLSAAAHYPDLAVATFATPEWETSVDPAFVAWYQEFRPECLLSVAFLWGDWIQKLRLKVPDDVGIAQLNRPQAVTDIAGVVTSPSLQGRLAVERIHQLILNNEIGVPEDRTIIRVDGNWQEGRTVAPGPPAPRRRPFTRKTSS
jgi:LacI family transcriptional regulator